jgi:hypothetical protein
MTSASLMSISAEGPWSRVKRALRCVGIPVGDSQYFRVQTSLRIAIIGLVYKGVVAMRWAETAASMNFAQHSVESIGHGPGGDCCRGPRWH